MSNAGQKVQDKVDVQFPATVSPSSSNEEPKSSPDDSIFVPINLEASLGRIEDDQTNVDPSSHSDDVDAMSCCKPCADDVYRPRTTSTSEGRDRFDQQAHVISPFPFSQTEAEIRERERLAGAVRHLQWTFQGGPLDDCTTAPTAMSTGQAFAHDVEDPATTSWSHSDLMLIPDDDDDNCDDFSISSGEAESLVVEDLMLDRMCEDPSSFWEDGMDVNDKIPDNGVSGPCCVSVVSQRGSLSSTESP